MEISWQWYGNRASSSSKQCIGEQGQEILAGKGLLTTFLKMWILNDIIVDNVEPINLISHQCTCGYCKPRMPTLTKIHRHTHTLTYTHSHLLYILVVLYVLCHTFLFRAISCHFQIGIPTSIMSFINVSLDFLTWVRLWQQLNSKFGNMTVQHPGQVTQPAYTLQRTCTAFFSRFQTSKWTWWL